MLLPHRRSPLPLSYDYVHRPCCNGKRQSLNGLHFSDSFNGTPDVPETGDDTEPQKDQSQPGRRIKFAVQPDPDAEADKNGKGNGEAQTAVISKLLECAPGFSFHENGTISCWKRHYKLFQNQIDLKVQKLTKD